MRLVLIIHLSRRRPSLSHGLKVCPVSARLPYEPLQSGAARIVSEVHHVRPLQRSFFFFFCRAFFRALVSLQTCQNGRERNVNWRMLHVKSAQYANTESVYISSPPSLYVYGRRKPSTGGYRRSRPVDRPPDNMQRFVNGQGTRSQLNVQCVFTRPRRLIKLTLTKPIYFKSAPSLPLMFATVSSSCNNLNVNDRMIFLFCGFEHATR